MKKALILLFAFSAVTLSGFEPAVSDIDIDPLDRLPGVRLEATENEAPSARSRDSSRARTDRHAGQASEEECDGPIEDCADIDFDAYAEYTAEEVTVGDIMEAVRKVGLPPLTIQFQPGGTTLVNFETIFYADAPVFERTVELLGYAVDLRAAPASFTWHHGDGTSQTTTSPGHTYPNHDVTHTYEHAADNIRPRVDVSYQVSYRIDSHTWETLPGTITAPGAAASLSVEQGLPLLTRP